MVWDGNAGSEIHVLIVDDIEINVDILSNIIEQLGYIPLPAGSVEEALSIIKRVLPQLILLDVSMPRVDGYEFCAILKKKPVTRHIPVIFVSALDSIKDKLKGLELGAADFITKPFEITEVTMRVKNQMENYRMKQELETFNHKLHKMLNEQTRKIESEKKEILCSLARLIEKRSGAADRHLENVGYNSRILAEGLQLSSSYEMKISEDFIDMIETASKFHDLGRLWDSCENPEDLPDSHIETGAAVLEELLHNELQSEFTGMALAIIRYHHTEWKDGGEREIPLEARIVRITNDFDHFALKESASSDPRWESLERIRAGSGTSYDPGLVEILLKIQRQLRIN